MILETPNKTVLAIFARASLNLHFNSSMSHPGTIFQRFDFNLKYRSLKKFMQEV